MRWLLAVLCTALFGALSGGANAGPKDVFEITGVAIGDSIEKKFPNWQTPGKGCYTSGARIASCGTVADDFAGLRSYMTSYRYLDGKFVGLEVTLPSIGFGDLVGMLTGKYGKPSSETIKSAKNKFGHSRQYVESTWKFKGGSLVASQVYLSFDTARLSYDSKEYTNAARAAEQEKLQAKGKSAL